MAVMAFTSRSEKDAERDIATCPLVISAANSWLLTFTERNPSIAPPKIMLDLVSRWKQTAREWVSRRRNERAKFGSSGFLETPGGSFKTMRGCPRSSSRDDFTVENETSSTLRLHPLAVGIVF